MPPIYSTTTRVNSAFPPINSVTNINSAIIAQYMDDVEAEINVKIARRYQLPITGTCPILVAISTRETIYRIAVERSLVQFPPAQQGKHPMQSQHDADQKLLDKIANGEIPLLSSSMEEVTENTADVEVWTTTMGYNPTFHEGPWTEMRQDPSKIEDALADRGLTDGS